jgi:hypothetical protein
MRSRCACHSRGQFMTEAQVRGPLQRLCAIRNVSDVSRSQENQIDDLLNPAFRGARFRSDGLITLANFQLLMSDVSTHRTELGF